MSNQEELNSSTIVVDDDFSDFDDKLNNSSSTISNYKNNLNINNIQNTNNVVPINNTRNNLDLKNMKTSSDDDTLSFFDNDSNDSNDTISDFDNDFNDTVSDFDNKEEEEYMEISFDNLNDPINNIVNEKMFNKAINLIQCDLIKIKEEVTLNNNISQQHTNDIIDKILHINDLYQILNKKFDYLNNKYDKIINLLINNK